MRPRLRAGLAAVALTLPLAGCGTHERAAGSATSSVTERDYHIGVPASLPAGRVRIDVRNSGPDTHELLIVHGRAGHLPLRPDGITVDESRLGRSLVGIAEGIPPHADHHVTVRFAPGHYVLICNMTGHYLGGMRTDVVVR